MLLGVAAGVFVPDLVSKPLVLATPSHQLIRAGPRRRSTRTLMIRRPIRTGVRCGL